MQILLANAKIMNNAAPAAPLSSPRFADVARQLAAEMALHSEQELAEMLSCSAALASENLGRYQNFPFATLMPAIMAYNGQAYKHLKATTLSPKTLDFAQEHLWITCFLYGLLRPMDGIAPYRMEHTVRLEATDEQPLSQWWKPLLTDMLIKSVKDDDGILIHLSTEEYEHLFDWKHVKQEVRVVQPLFYVRKGQNIKMQAVWAKTCRGAMVRYILENNISNVEELTAFSYEGFIYNLRYGEADYPHFIKEN